MKIKNIIIVIFIAIFCLNNELAYSKNIENNSMIYKIDKTDFFINEQVLYTTSVNGQEAEEQRLESIYKTGLFLPGVGQFIFEDQLKTLVFTPVLLALVGVFIYGISPAGHGWGIITHSFPALMSTVLLYFISGIDLSLTYDKKLREVNNIKISKEREKIDQTYLMNVFLPGLGDIYSGDILRSVFYISAAAATGGVIINETYKKGTSDLFSLVLALLPLLYGVSLIDSTIKHESDKKQLAKTENNKIEEKTYLPQENIDTNNFNNNIQVLSYSFKF